MKFRDKINKMFFNDYFMTNDDAIIQEYVLAEARGVAMFPYRYYIDEIYKYVVDRIKTHSGKINSEKREQYFKKLGKISSVSGEIQTDSDFDFWLPQRLLKPFTFVKELNIHIIASQYKNTNNVSIDDAGEGMIGYDNKKARLTRSGKVDFAVIEVKCKYNRKNGYVFERSLYSTLFHEMNHLYMLWNQLKEKDVVYTSIAKSNDKVYNEVSDALFSDSEMNNYLWLLTYRLFNFNERAAGVASVYGDLKQFYPDYRKRPPFQETVKKTQAYYEYEELKNGMDSFLGNLTNEDIINLSKFFKSKKIYMKNYANDFKLSLKNKINLELENYLHRICKTASLYYEEMADLYNNSSYHFFVNYP